ncbi:ubiquitin-like small modifier protein 1 [Natrarchaeobius chitinivorans]|uniref:MoaD/ThiS family protein n=1 Tax=Natrarchaeobius chitinivorans TaxID=1679083 RepID=A0A3N6N5H4_NATCH|nr:ubiquitin-like small modifier protein 1 [Natrarchaeobius chitinivorans]RQG93532.1 MoaD/ThiS family protein [Natrarchaeobius chitinivorans]
MAVTCDFYGTLRDAVGQKSVTHDVSDETTVGELLETIAEEHPELEEALFSDGTLRETMNVSVNARHVRLDEGLETPVEDGDVIRAYPPVEGGAD